MVVQEALHAGAAVVATDAGGTGAVVGDAAVLVPPTTRCRCRGAIRAVVVHGAVRDDCGRARRARADAAHRGRRAGEPPSRLPVGVPAASEA